MAKWFPYPFTAFFLCTFWSCIVQLILSFRTFMTFSGWGEVPASAWGAVAFCAVFISFVAHSGQAWAVSAAVPPFSVMHGLCTLARSMHGDLHNVLLLRPHVHADSPHAANSSVTLWLPAATANDSYGSPICGV